MRAVPQSLLPIGTLALCLAVLAQPANAAKFKVIHSFCAEANCTDGALPSGRLLKTSDGTLYGTTSYGGNLDNGVIFALIPKDTKYRYKVLHSFCGDGNGGCPDGGVPVSGLIVDTAGNLYGTAFETGPHNGGTFFELSPDAAHKTWTYITLYGFCAEANCADGSGPDTTLAYAGALQGFVYDGTSALYGTTSRGGGANAGVAYRLMYNGNAWTEDVVHSFCSKNNCLDGQYPTGVVADADGNLFGTTINGGPFTTSGGIAFKLKAKTFDEVDLYDFCSAQGCPDGNNPIGTVTMDASGLVVGTTRYGGALNGGVIFRIDRPGRETVLQNLNAYSENGVVIDSSGKVYGAMTYGAAQNAGAAFRLSGSQFKLQHIFCSDNDPVSCADGNNPSSVMVGASGVVFGTAARGGLFGQGVIFQIVP